MKTKLYNPCHAAGGMSSYVWEDDPKRLGFLLARYKFVAKMLAGRKDVLEIGCADGFGSRVVAQHVGSLTAVDCDPRSIAEAEAKASPRWRINFRLATYPNDIWRPFSAIYSLDVLEHIHPRKAEDLFLRSIAVQSPVAIIGTPSLESQPHASKLSKADHVNCKTEEQLQETLSRYWNNVFLFGMNDETLHTGFGPMCHYRFALCVR
jgi:cyclopropane fatty-acyl-phospholipid synthase-like methyltransferase